MKITINHIAKNYGKKEVLKDISFTAASGKCIGILGSNGSGKSTLLSILAGIQPANGGEFLCEDKDLFKFPSERAELVGYVPQGTPLIEELSAKDNLSLWYSAQELKRELDGGLLSLLGINDFINVTVSKMSGGMKKRLSIGCAIAKHPPILLLDEPMAALDLACKQEICNYLRRHKEAGGIILLASHDVTELELCDECYIIKNGLVKEFYYDGNLNNLVKSL